MKKYVLTVTLALLNSAYASDIKSIDFEVQNGTLNVSCGNSYQVQSHGDASAAKMKQYVKGDTLYVTQGWFADSARSVVINVELPSTINNVYVVPDRK